MSLQSWKKEFYPIDAKDVRKKDAVEHSIKKWEGLRRENLERHDLVLKYGWIVVDICSEERFAINGETCALCVHYFEGGCYYCPLKIVNGHVPCFKQNESDINIYSEFTDHSDPEPMIEMLKKARDLK